MAPLPEYVRDYVSTQHLSYFQEAHSIEDAAAHFGQSYKTMARHVKKYADAGHLLVVRREGNKKIFQTASDNDIPFVTLNGKQHRLDQFLTYAVPVVAEKKKAAVTETTLSFYALYYRSYLVTMLAAAIKKAREEDGDPENQLNILREFLLRFQGYMQEKLQEIHNLLDHPTLWDVDNLIEWANNNVPISGLDQRLPGVIEKHWDAIEAGPIKELERQRET